MAAQRQRYVIKDPAQIDALVSPFRHHLLRTLNSIGPATVRTLGEHLGRSPESLYYHLRALEGVGLVVNKHAESEQPAEALYETVARLILTDRQANDAAYMTAYRKSASALLRLADRQFGKAIEEQIDEGRTRSPSLRIQQLQVRLSPADAKTLATKLDELVEFMAEHDHPEGKQAIAVTLVSSPLDHPRST